MHYSSQFFTKFFYLSKKFRLCETKSLKTATHLSTPDTGVKYDYKFLSLSTVFKRTIQQKNKWIEKNKQIDLCKIFKFILIEINRIFNSLNENSTDSALFDILYFKTWNSHMQSETQYLPQY